LPIAIPNNLLALDDRPVSSFFDSWLERQQPFAIVLSGGNDVGEFADRDHTEIRLLEYARNARLPLLGICRGMQMMAVWAGAQLKEVSGHVRTRHELAGAWADNVNSFHRSALKGCPKEFVVTAMSQDGEIEAIEHTTLPWQGWMWHPEREAEFAASDQIRFKSLLGRMDNA
jgi:putative glutamine amidotransferase